MFSVINFIFGLRFIRFSWLFIACEISRDSFGSISLNLVCLEIFIQFK